MSEDWDVVIVGSGPAGVSAAFPLSARNLRVLIVDAGVPIEATLPQTSYLDARRNDPGQWRWMIGEDFYALRSHARASPKFRAPTLRSVFRGFAEANQIHGENFEVIGSIATGGLSNAWGCGVARFDDEELAEFPFPASDLMASYRRIAVRIGISGKNEDGLSSYYGVDQWSQSGIPLDNFHAALVQRYRARRPRMESLGFQIGRARMAVLAEDTAGRGKCELLGTCLWGCSRDALYSARMDLQQLRKRSNVGWRPEFIVARLQKERDNWAIHGHDRTSGRRVNVRARVVILAAGCLATNRLVLDALDLVGRPARLFSNPTAGFIVWFPLWTGSAPQKGFASSQLSFTIPSKSAKGLLFGFLFPTSGLPVSEFVEYLPLGRRYAVDVLKYLLPSSIVGNLFLPGTFSQHTVSLTENRCLRIVGNYPESVFSIFAEARRNLARALRSLGGLLPPNAFIQAAPGSDVHYAGGVPMRAQPKRGECNELGEIAGLNGVFVVDGAAFPSLPAKPHTLTIMANADRIASEIAQRWSSAEAGSP